LYSGPLEKLTTKDDEGYEDAAKGPSSTKDTKENEDAAC
jgi:hypothetical protein